MPYLRSCLTRLVICRVHRHQGEEAIGAICLNLTRCPGSAAAAGSKQALQAPQQGSVFGQALAAALRSLGKRCVELPLAMQAVRLLSSLLAYFMPDALAWPQLDSSYAAIGQLPKTSLDLCCNQAALALKIL